MKLKIDAQQRTTVRKSDNNSLRLKGEIPAIVYGANVNNMMVSLNEREFTKLYRQSIGELAVWEIVLDGKTYSTVIKEKQMHPVSRKIRHIDFMVLDNAKPIHIKVPLKFVGEAPGTKLGGTLEILNRKIEIACLPQNMPEDIEIDLSNLMVGQTIHVSDLKPVNFEIKAALNLGLATVHGTKGESKDTEVKEEA